jgi:hypothetical protein
MDKRRATDSRPGEPAGDAWGPSFGLLAVAVGIVVGALAWWWASDRDEQAAPVPAVAAAPVAPTVALANSAPVVVSAAASASPPVPHALPPTPAASVAPLRDPNGDQTPDLSDYVNPGEQPTMAQVIERLHQAGVHTGLGAFSPPGTRPPLVGLAVPDDYALPDGYVRHYQATDDGQRIEPILMFAPGRTFVDASGQAVTVPPDRVVPPELAPAGLPIRRIAIPASTDTGRPRN